MLDLNKICCFVLLKYNNTILTVDFKAIYRSNTYEKFHFVYVSKCGGQCKVEAQFELEVFR